MEIVVGDKTYQIQIERSRIKNMYLRIQKDGTIKVSCPTRVKDEDIQKFILSKQDWLITHLSKMEQSDLVNQESITNDVIYWMGEKKRVRYIQGKRDICWLDGDVITFELTQITDEKLQKAFRKAAVSYLEYLVKQYRTQWDQKICMMNGIPLPEIKIRYMTSRWGVCQPHNAKITLSTRLIHYPIQAFEYVLLHEYAHFLVPNHSDRFYQVVKTHMPQYKTYNNLLK